MPIIKQLLPPAEENGIWTWGNPLLRGISAGSMTAVACKCWFVIFTAGQ